jgi:hypothetical protein
MSTSPDNPLFSRSEILKTPQPVKTPNWMQLHKETFTHLSSMVAGAVLSEATTDFLYKINYRLFELAGSPEALTVLDKYHSVNLGMSLVGGIIAGDFIYRSWKSSQTTSK